MTGNLKVLGLALLAVCALGAVAGQGALAATDHEFHAAEEKVIVTGHSKDEPRSKHKFVIGAAGTVECSTVQTESTQKGTLVSAGTYRTDKITVTPHYSECSFEGGTPATVNFNHCYYEFESETTKGNKTNEAAEHANFEIKCDGEPARIEIHSVLCTITLKPQQVKHAVKYNNVPGTNGKKAITLETTAEKIVLDKSRTTAAQPINGCLAFPPNGSAVGTYTGDVKTECSKDLNEPLSGTNATTPTGLTIEGAAVDCTFP